ncbi:unnamed protein product [Moneuplotes crassus]|uniref:Uncharacterized protein n=1 Tax=Euplotes crassus TaxID=5936 RepID=A0AAD1Y007_EUPCR|nr:unnamed protein product [Moneuplotes crassus]
MIHELQNVILVGCKWNASKSNSSVPVSFIKKKVSNSILLLTHTNIRELLVELKIGDIGLYPSFPHSVAVLLLAGLDGIFLCKEEDYCLSCSLAVISHSNDEAAFNVLIASKEVVDHFIFNSEGDSSELDTDSVVQVKLGLKCRFAVFCTHHLVIFNILVIYYKLSLVST